MDQYSSIDLQQKSQIEQIEEFLQKPGYELNTDNDLQKIEFLNKELEQIANLLNPKAQKNQNQSTIEQDTFIGAHPISIDSDSLNEICKNQSNYLICEKSDGVRYLLIILNNGYCYLNGRYQGSQYTRKQAYYQCNIQMPTIFKTDFDEESQLNKSEEDNQLYNDLKINYIFDGELIADAYKAQITEELFDTKIIFKYLIYDTIVYQNTKDVFKKKYLDRLQYAQKFIRFRQAMKQIEKTSEMQIGLQISMSAFGIEGTNYKSQKKIKLFLKDFYEVQHIEYLFNSLIPCLAHKNDGIIFTKNSDKAPYVMGRTSDILK